MGEGKRDGGSIKERRKDGRNRGKAGETEERREKQRKAEESEEGNSWRRDEEKPRKYDEMKQLCL